MSESPGHCPPIHINSAHIESVCRGESAEGEAEVEIEIEVEVEAEAEAVGGIRRPRGESYHAHSNTAYSNFQYAPCSQCGSDERQNPTFMRERDCKR